MLSPPLRTALRQISQPDEASQASTSQEVLAEINKKGYNFKRKGSKAQFNFNVTVEDHIDAAKRPWPLRVMQIRLP